MGIQWVAVAVLAVLASAASVQAQQQGSCRMDEAARHNFCGLPFELSNFQGLYECKKDVKVGRPASVQEAQALVKFFDRVKGVGVGHSWWKEQFCAGSNNQSINLVMTELKPSLDFILRPVNPSQWRNKTIPADFPIQVNEEARTVTLNAGITQRQLLEYLAAYRFWKQPAGWVLPAFSWFIDQTIAGAISTGTHGSSLKWGSLSSQLRGIEIILADGSLQNITPDEDPHLWKALGVSVGRLGVITRVTLRIKPQQAVRRKLQELEFDELAEQVKSVQDAYVAAKNAGDENGMKLAAARLDETQSLWIVPLRQAWRTDYEWLDKEPLSVLLNIDATDPLVQAMNGPTTPGVFAQQNKQPVPPNNRITTNARFWGNFYSTSMRQFVTPGTYESSRSFISMSEFGNQASSTMQPYDQLEVAVPFEKMGDCLMEVGGEIYGPKNLWEGFRAPALVRFISGEEFYLSPTNGGPGMYVNIEDHVTRSAGKPNDKYNEVVKLFLDRCDARLHWGKYGWPEFLPCFDGAAAYPETWCDFGCAVQQLDPTGKFRSESNVWRWNATRGGQTVEFSSCCTPQGFDKSQCKCASSPACQK